MTFNVGVVQKDGLCVRLPRTATEAVLLRKSVCRCGLLSSQGTKSIANHPMLLNHLQVGRSGDQQRAVF